MRQRWLLWKSLIVAVIHLEVIQTAQVVRLPAAVPPLDHHRVLVVGVDVDIPMKETQLIQNKRKLTGDIRSISVKKACEMSQTCDIQVGDSLLREMIIGIKDLDLLLKIVDILQKIENDRDINKTW